MPSPSKSPTTSGHRPPGSTSWVKVPSPSDHSMRAHPVALVARVAGEILRPVAVEVPRLQVVLRQERTCWRRHIGAQRRIPLDAARQGERRERDRDDTRPAPRPSTHATPLRRCALSPERFPGNLPEGGLVGGSNVRPGRFRASGPLVVLVPISSAHRRGDRRGRLPSMGIIVVAGPRPEEALEAVALGAGHDVGVKVRDALAHRVVHGHEGALGAGGVPTADRQGLDPVEKGATSPAGRSGSVTWWTRGTSRTWPWNRGGRRGRRRPVVSSTTCAGSVAGHDAAEDARGSTGTDRPSGTAEGVDAGEGGRRPRR